MRTDASAEEMARVGELWADIVSGKVPLMYDSAGVMQANLSPVTRYSEYADGWNGPRTMTILTVGPEFFAEMDKRAESGEYRKYEASGKDIAEAADAAWARVMDDFRNGTLPLSFREDYESTVPPQYAHDGLAHCYLYMGADLKRPSDSPSD